jgi:molybdopterin-guanine dinucleotide biosynthesis protein A
VAALEASAAEHVLVVATDQPLVTPRFLRALAAAEPAEATVPRDASGSHPLCARYRRASVLGPARARLAGSDLSLQGLLAALDTRWLEGDALRRADPDGAALLNVNTPADLERAEALLAAR